ncbi:Rer1 protein [Operophtera brumata]|uniref:Rer1 protein n=1 Tax=Operophtera brumata TaxID=104452 RepID=A0A0L7L5M4_OPEBR|nr:Rer1 protein [Operophtera brumata]
MMDGSDLSSENNRKGIISQAWTRLSQVYQGTLDQWTPHMKSRWVGSAVLLAIFMLRIFTKQGWYIVTYALGIYHLNLFIAFLTPKIDPAMDFDVFWPILVMYFITLLCITMKRQIKHMLKYRYLPFTHSKPKYKTVDSTVTVN